MDLLSPDFLRKIHLKIFFLLSGTLVLAWFFFLLKLCYDFPKTPKITRK